VSGLNNKCKYFGPRTFVKKIKLSLDGSFFTIKRSGLYLVDFSLRQNFEGLEILATLNENPKD